MNCIKKSEGRKVLGFSAYFLLLFLMTGLVFIGFKAEKVSAAAYALSGFAALDFETVCAKTDSIEALDVDAGCAEELSHTDWNTDFNNDDLRYMSAIIYAEANGLTFDAKLAVANVILNRMNDTRDWKHVSTVHDVIYDKKYAVQFSPIKDGSMKKALAIYDSMDPSKYKKWQIEAMNACIEASKAAFRGEKAVPDDFMYFRQYKSSTREMCMEKGYRFAIIDKHIYYTKRVIQE